MAKKRKGLLPNDSELIAMGYAEMVLAMREKPALFRHIPQAKGRKIPTAHVRAIVYHQRLDDALRAAA
jgi:hypothetical protein